MIFLLYSWFILIVAAIPAALIWKNLSLFQPAARANSESHDERVVSLLIPARDEEAGIREALQSVLQSEYPQLEVIVMDDNSTDKTAEIVTEIASNDPRLKLYKSGELPEGWNGKQHACWQLADVASGDLLLFMDADVRLARGAIRRMVAQLDASQTALLSGFPKQITGSLPEKLLIPLMYHILLGYLPLDRMRASNKPEFGAGCGQLFLTTKEDYLAADGHRAIADSRHDGLKLPRAFRSAGLHTDLFDASDIAQVRMYSGWRTVFLGLMKNATEGVANKKLIWIFTVLLLCGAVLPVLSFLHAIYYGWLFIDSGRMWSTLILGVATVLSFAARYQIAKRLESTKIGVWLQPLAVGIFLAVQWLAFIRKARGKGQLPWRGRA